MSHHSVVMRVLTVPALALALAGVPGIALADQAAEIAEEEALVAVSQETVEATGQADESVEAVEVVEEAADEQVEDALPLDDQGVGIGDELPADEGVAMDDAEAIDTEATAAADEQVEAESASEDAVAPEADPAEAEVPAEAEPVAEEQSPAPLAAPSYFDEWVKVGSDYIYYNKSGNTQTAWVITQKDLNNVVGAAQRYWIDPSTGRLALSKLVQTGAAAWAYARPEGYVVRGKWTDTGTGYVYLANNDGRLENTGWLVSNKYGDGLQRYYIDKTAHAAIPGYAADQWDHYTRKEGFVARGRYTDPDTGYLYLADNDGKLEKTGWMVTNKYDANKKLQRYYVDKVAHAIIPGHNLIDGNHYYVLAETGYVLRGKLAVGNGMLLANNDGKLAWKEGWLVTKEYDKNLQRYRIDGAPGSGLMGAHVGIFAVSGATYYGTQAEGYVARNIYVDPKTSYVYLADNDGRLEKTGWVITNKYDPNKKLQRYYIDPVKHAAIPGHLQLGGAHYYVRPEVGYVLRGKLAMGKGMLLADNDGKLAWNVGWLVTSAYDGKLQRYLIGDTPGNGLRGATLGEFTTGGKKYYGDTSQGYVARNASVRISGTWYHADNDGVLTVMKNGKYGYQNPAGYYQLSSYTVVLPDYCTGIFGYVSPNMISPGATRSQCVEAFIARAYDYLGTTYIWDYACAPGVGVDCAGLVLQCMYAVGITPDKYTPYDHYYTPGHDHYANDMRNDGKMMTLSVGERQRGDLICYYGHIAIYLGNDQIIHAYPGSVFISSMYYNGMSPIAVKRVFI